MPWTHPKYPLNNETVPDDARCGGCRKTSVRHMLPHKVDGKPFAEWFKNASNAEQSRLFSASRCPR